MLLRKPLSGAILGILIGLCVAVVLARQGIWPPDRLTVFLLPAITGLLGMLLLTMGREGSNTTLVIALVLLVPMAIWGALGFGEIDQNGELNGGCTVTATSDLDTTTVTDTSRGDPFEIDPDGGLAWTATSPEAFIDYDWQLEVVVGGIAIPIESDTEPNDAGDLENGGEVPDVGEYASERGIDLDLYVGVYQVGGSAASCDGFGFVSIVGDGLDLVTIIALVLLLILIIIVAILFYPGRRAKREAAAAAASGETIDVHEKLKGYEAGSTEFPTTNDEG